MRARDRKELDSIIASAGRFGQREHVELAWTFLARYPLREANSATVDAIQHLATVHDENVRFHRTMTIAWLRLVAVHRRRSRKATFQEFISENPELLDKRLLDGHYSREVLMSARAHTTWTDPDLRALPAL